MDVIKFYYKHDKELWHINILGKYTDDDLVFMFLSSLFKSRDDDEKLCAMEHHKIMS